MKRNSDSADSERKTVTTSAGLFARTLPAPVKPTEPCTWTHVLSTYLARRVDTFFAYLPSGLHDKIGGYCGVVTALFPPTELARWPLTQYKEADITIATPAARLETLRSWVSYMKGARDPYKNLFLAELGRLGAVHRAVAALANHAASDERSLVLRLISGYSCSVNCHWLASFGAIPILLDALESNFRPQAIVCLNNMTFRTPTTAAWLMDNDVFARVGRPCAFSTTGDGLQLYGNIIHGLHILSDGILDIVLQNIATVIDTAPKFRREAVNLLDWLSRKTYPNVHEFIHDNVHKLVDPVICFTDECIPSVFEILATMIRTNQERILYIMASGLLQMLPLAFEHKNKMVSQRACWFMRVAMAQDPAYYLAVPVYHVVAKMLDADLDVSGNALALFGVFMKRCAFPGGLPRMPHNLHDALRNALLRGTKMSVDIYLGALADTNKDKPGVSDVVKTTVDALMTRAEPTLLDKALTIRTT